MDSDLFSIHIRRLSTASTEKSSTPSGTACNFETANFQSGQLRIEQPYEHRLICQSAQVFPICAPKLVHGKLL